MELNRIRPKIPQQNIQDEAMKIIGFAMAITEVRKHFGVDDGEL